MEFRWRLAQLPTLPGMECSSKAASRTIRRGRTDYSVRIVWMVYANHAEENDKLHRKVKKLKKWKRRAKYLQYCNDNMNYVEPSESEKALMQMWAHKMIQDLNGKDV